MNTEDTIAAISTPPGVGGIAMIRISGDSAVTIADKLFQSSRDRALSSAKTHTIHHGYIVDENAKVIDEVLVSVMLSPNTYTKENVVEISCHGGIVSARAILEAVLNAGARSALPGEFTKRAFLNGRIDLCEAESVIDIINSKTSTEQAVGVNQLRGHLSKNINDIRNNLLELISHLQVLIDFADEDLEPLTDEEYLNGLKKSHDDITALLNSAVRGRIIKNGIKTAIIGKPNVGKSSLLNLLCGDDKAIVTDIEGTTRDAIEECVMLGKVMLDITDTAGIRNTSDAIESIGVEKSKSVMKDAELVIYMTDAQKKLDENDKFIIDSLKDKNAIVLINKYELKKEVDEEYLRKMSMHVIPFSVKEKIGLEELSAQVEKMFDMGTINVDSDSVITNIRHSDALKKARAALDGAINAIENGIPLNMTFIDIENAVSALGEITGQTVGEEIIDRIFHNFCVGK